MIHLGRYDKLLEELCRDRRPIIITDTNLIRIYGSFIERYPHIVIGVGESVKTLDTVAQISRELLKLEADRGSLLVGFGGGIVTDIVGFVASTYMRGVKFGFVATTLLGQVDASIGGKNGVNLDGYKNIVGTFNLPEFIIADPAVLDTLPEREFLAAMGEVIKYALIEDPEIFEITDRGAIIERCMNIKQRIVEADFRESGERKLLNLGHTFGHAIEKIQAGRYLHGEAVAIGVCIAARLSVEVGLLDKNSCDQIVERVAALNLPVSHPGVSLCELSQIVLSDKKRAGNTIDLILLTKIGQAVIYPITIDRLMEICVAIDNGNC